MSRAPSTIHARERLATREPSSQSAGTPPRRSICPPWPPGIHSTVRHHTLVRLTGKFDDEALQAVQTIYPWRHVTRCGSEIVVWPLGTTGVSHEPEAVVIRGRFDARDHSAVQAAHPGRTVSHDGDLITVWPARLTPPRR